MINNYLANKNLSVSTSSSAVLEAEATALENSLSPGFSAYLSLGKLKRAYSQRITLGWQIFAAAVFLVSVPVFIEAPLVRIFPWLSLGLTGFWFYLSYRMMRNSQTNVWGDLIFGFSWSWLAGSIYWGWLRWEPLWHLPVEALGVPFAIWCLLKQRYLIGTWFYLGSLLGTILTDVYFYLVNLIPYWRKIMVSSPDQVSEILHGAVAQLDTPWGVAWAVILAWVLLFAGLMPLTQRSHHSYAFAGAVLSTILVDVLFLLAALAA